MGILKRRINTKLGKYNYIEIFVFLKFSGILGWINRKKTRMTISISSKAHKNHGWTNGRNELESMFISVDMKKKKRERIYNKSIKNVYMEKALAILMY